MPTEYTTTLLFQRSNRPDLFFAARRFGPVAGVLASICQILMDRLKGSKKQFLYKDIIDMAPRPNGQNGISPQVPKEVHGRKESALDFESVSSDASRRRASSVKGPSFLSTLLRVCDYLFIVK